MRTAKWAWLSAAVVGSAGLVACEDEGLNFPDGFVAVGGTSAGAASGGTDSAGKAGGAGQAVAGSSAGGITGQAGKGSGGSSASGAGSGGTDSSSGGENTTGGTAGADGGSAGAGTSGKGGSGSGAGGKGGKGGGAGSSAQAGTSSDGGTAGAGGGEAGLVPAFIAVGHQQRTTISCDDGQTWTQDAAADDAECWATDNMPDCDHSEFAGRGLAYGKGWFVAAWGWGDPGTITRTHDGMTWETVMEDSPTFAGIAFGKDTFVADGSPAFTSSNAESWEEQDDTKLGVLYRGIGFVDYDGGRFIAVGQDGDDLAISFSPDGKTWTRAADNDGCGTNFLGIADGNGTAVLAGGDGSLCWSEDGGNHWTRVSAGSELTTNPIWTGSEFMVYNRSRLYRSADGKTWSNETTSPSNLDLGPMARSADGTFVAANQEWQQWYGSQEFYRSTDGKTWQVLPSSAFDGSHPIRFIQAGYVAAGGACPPN